MLKGKSVTLRPVRESDLDRLYTHHVDIDSQGEFNYLDEYELSYHVYTLEQRGKGVATEAVNLLVRYLFESKRVNRIRLIIHPDNRASRRLAEKCGFKHEGTARGAWYHGGVHRDVEVYAILHDEALRV